VDHIETLRKMKNFIFEEKWYFEATWIIKEVKPFKPIL
jgi:hypothetical protein